MRAAACARAARASETLTKSAPAVGGSRSATITAAPFAAASCACARPSSRAPASAKNTSPGCTLRLSQAIPPTAREASASSFSRSRMSPSRVIARRSLLADLVGVGSIPQTGYDGERLIWRILRRGHAFERLDAADQRACGAAGVPGGGMKAKIPWRRHGIVVGREIEIFRFVSRRDRHESGEHPGVGIVAVDDLVGGAGLAADVVARNVGETRGPVRRVGAHEVAH